MEDPLTLVEIALVGRPRANVWVLPKGTPHAEEASADAALREVREETGLTTRIVGEVGSVYYTFTRGNTRFRKQVLHYLLKAVGGDVSLHDAEYDDARWFPAHEALTRLTYHNEAQLLRAALDMLVARLRRTEAGGDECVPDAVPDAAPGSHGTAR